MKKLISVLIAISILILSIIQVSAASANTQVNLIGGQVTLSPITIGSFGDVVLTGLDQTVQANIEDFTITDARGTGQGWTLQVSAIRFGIGTNKMRDGALKITGAKGAPVGKSDDFDQSYINDSFVITEVPGNFIVVPQSKGKGTFTFTDAKLNFEIWPKEAIGGTYSTTITFDLVHNIN